MSFGDPSPDLRNLDPLRLLALKTLSAAVLGAYQGSRGGRFRIGRGVIANHRLIVKGPGIVTVRDGANLFAFGTGRRTRLITRTHHAEIRIGENARLNGSELQADTLIDIGANCIVGQAHLIDTDMHSLAVDRREDPEATVRTSPIILEPNVWVARGAAILPGVRIGQGSVVGYGAIVTSDVPASVVVAGNPARVVKQLG